MEFPNEAHLKYMGYSRYKISHCKTCDYDFSRIQGGSTKKMSWSLWVCLSKKFVLFLAPIHGNVPEKSSYAFRSAH